MTKLQHLQKITRRKKMPSPLARLRPLASRRTPLRHPPKKTATSPKMLLVRLLAAAIQFFPMPLAPLSPRSLPQPQLPLSTSRVCRRPAPPSCPAATTAAAATRATAAAGGGATGSAGGAAGAGGTGGAAGSTGGAAGAGGAGPITDRHCLSWPLSQQLQRLGVDSSGHCLSRTTPPPRSFRCVPGRVEASALGSSESAAAPGAGESATALGARESSDALGASASNATGPASTKALHTFTLDSGASCCFFRDCTTVTPLAAPVLVSLAGPTGGPVVARASSFLPCPAVPSRSLSGLHLPAFSTKLLSNAILQDEWVDTFIPGGQCVAICKCSRTGHHLATFTRQPGSAPYDLTTASAQVAEAGQVAASSWVSTSGHPSLPRLRSMHSRLLVSGLPRSLPSLPRSPASPCLLCVKGRQRAAPHSSKFPPTTAPLQTLHLDIWGPTPLRERFCRDLPVLRLHSDRGGEFSSDLVAEFCRDEGIRQSFTLPASPQQNGIAEHRIGLIMEVARTSMIHAAAPHFLWPFAVRYAAHQLNLWPRVSEPETSPTLRWTGKIGDASVFRGLAPSGVSQVDPPTLVEPFKISSDSSGPGEGGYPAADDMAATRRSPRLETPPGFPPRPSLPPPQPAGVDSGAETASAQPRGAETEGEGSGGAGSGGAAIGGADSEGAESPSGGGAIGDPSGGPRAGQPPQSDLLETLSPQVIHAWIIRQGSPGGGGYGPAGAGAASPEGTAGAGAASPGGTAGAGGTGGTAGGTGGAAGAGGTRGAAGAGGARATSPRGATGAAGAGPTSPGGTAGAGGAGGAAGARSPWRSWRSWSSWWSWRSSWSPDRRAGGTGGAGAVGPGGARTRGARAAGAGGAARGGGAGGATGAAGTGGVGGTAGARGARAAGARGAAGAGGATGAAGAGGAGAASAGGAGVAGTAPSRLFFYPQPQSSLPPPDSVLGQVLSLPSSTGLTPPVLCPPTDQSQPRLLPGSPLPTPTPHTEVTESLTERREPKTHASTLVRARRVARPRPPAVPGTHGMALRPSSVPQRVVLPDPSASSLLHVPDPESNLARAASPTDPCLLATVVTDPDFESTTVFALVTELVKFASRSRLDYVAGLVTGAEYVCPPSIGGELALRSDVLEDRQFELQCLAAALLYLVSHPC
ncbi:unnamed protein product [Closterium sp. NIES-54]